MVCRFSITVMIAVLAASTVSNAQSTLDVLSGGSQVIYHSDFPGSPGSLGTKGSHNTLATVNIPPASIIPTIDGVIAPGEWTDATTITPVTVVTPGCVAYMKSDACYIYVAAVVMGPAVYMGNATMINIWLDMNRNGQWELSPGNPAGYIDGNLALPAPGDLYPANGSRLRLSRASRMERFLYFKTSISSSLDNTSDFKHYPGVTCTGKKNTGEFDASFGRSTHRVY